MLTATDVKNNLFDIISDISTHPEDFSNNPGSDFSRNRKLGFSSLLHIFLSMGTGTVRDELLDFFSYDIGTATNSAFFQQRAKLNNTAMPYLFHRFNNSFEYAYYKGRYQLLAADGSSFAYTRNPKDQDSYFAPDGKTTNGYNQVHVIPLFDLLSKRYTDCIVQPIRKKNEFSALATLIDRHQAANGKIPVFIADRGFHSLNVFAHAIEKQAFFLIRATDVKTKSLLGTDFPEGQNSFDLSIERILTRSQSKKKRLCPEFKEQYKHICSNVAFDYIDPEQCPEYHISLRVLRFQLSSGGYENIITNLPGEEFSVDEIMYLYHLRWGIETSFRELKHVIGARYFHSKSYRYIVMEIWVRLLLYNFCSIVTGFVVISRKGRKHQLQVNYSFAYKICLKFLHFRGSGDPLNVEGLIEKHVLPIRPGRNNARPHRFRVPVSFNYRFC